MEACKHILETRGYKQGNRTNIPTFLCLEQNASSFGLITGNTRSGQTTFSSVGSPSVVVAHRLWKVGAAGKGLVEEEERRAAGELNLGAGREGRGSERSGRIETRLAKADMAASPFQPRPKTKSGRRGRAHNPNIYSPNKS